MGATEKQIEAAIGMVVCHYIPFRAIRAGHQLSDSKGASAAISAEVAVLSVHRAMRGFVGPEDVIRNPEAIFRHFQPTQRDESPFDLVLTHSGNDFSVMGMHFKLGLYEHQSAGALQGLIDITIKYPEIFTEEIKSVKVVAYQPAFGIIGDPHKRDPHTRQSADHSMVYILATKLKKALALIRDKALGTDNDTVWKQLMLTPHDYATKAIFDPDTRKIMEKITFSHGGKEYDEKYPEGIPTSVVITTVSGQQINSGLVMFPSGHARNTTCTLEEILYHKFKMLASLAVKDVDKVLKQLSNLHSKTADEIDKLYKFDIIYSTQKGEY